MSNIEMPLVLFSVLSQTAVGLVIINAGRNWAAEGPVGISRSQWGIVLAFLITGMIASFFHLGHPLQAFTTLKHLSKAWLSWELLGITLFLCLALIGFFTGKDKKKSPVVFLAALVGLLTLVFMGMTYAPPGYPALNNALPLVFFLLTALLLGTSFSAWFTPAEKRPLLFRILTVSLIVGLVVYLLVPCIWLSGGTVTMQTAWSWLSSPLYWGRVGIGLLLPLILLWRLKDIPLWLPVIILIGELLGRAAFFKETVHAAANIGGLY
ncbi:MAG: DmsC/YnfH family molybdoenzyme membrane anchor subunit [Desulfopila sp.]|jgi:DMSO reductase anchor subunit|nr:DmsC/YnfH family molybdoenzyme membrane anchor subunit [Desulfopila sp.]